MLISQSCLKITCDGAAVPSVNIYGVSAWCQAVSWTQMGRGRGRHLTKASGPSPAMTGAWGGGCRPEQGVSAGLGQGRGHKLAADRKTHESVR